MKKIALLSIILAAVVISLTVHPEDAGLRNQREIARLLRSAKLVIADCCVVGVDLGSQLRLLPDQIAEVNGYKLKLRTHGKSFELEAVPKAYGVTGYHSLYVDETGVVRRALKEKPTSKSPPL